MSGPKRATALLWAMTLLGAAGAAATFPLAGRERFWANWLFALLIVTTAGLGCLFLVALERVVGAVWSVPVRRVPERLASLLLLAAPAAAILLLGLPALYPWSRPEAATNRILAGKAVWLNAPFFSARTLAIAALWLLAYWILVKGSVKQDTNNDLEFTLRARRFAPAFLFIFAITVTLVAFDWISSLEPEWYSDIFGVYLFAGTFMAGLAASALGVVWLKENGRLPDVRPDHLYNFGGLLFAFTVFWSYIGFAQYLLMWYADMPEEITWYKARIEGQWLPVILLLALLHFVIPFFVLAARRAKSDLKVLKRIAILILFAHALDLYWLVFPALRKGVLFSWPEASFLLLAIGGGLLWARRSMAMGQDMPVGDPLLKAGLEFRL